MLLFLVGGGRLNAQLYKLSDPTSVTGDIKRAFSDEARQIIKAGAIGFGEIASLHISAAPGHSYEFVPADHPLLRVLADVAAKFDVPISIWMPLLMPCPLQLVSTMGIIHRNCHQRLALCDDY